MAASRCFIFMYFLITPLGAGHMVKPGTDQHKGRITVWEAAHHTGAAADLSQFSGAITLLVRMRVQGSLGKLQ